jgi:hypothetical protein
VASFLVLLFEFFVSTAGAHARSLPVSSPASCCHCDLGVRIRSRFCCFNSSTTGQSQHSILAWEFLLHAKSRRSRHLSSLLSFLFTARTGQLWYSLEIFVLPPEWTSPISLPLIRLLVCSSCERCHPSFVFFHCKLRPASAWSVSILTDFCSDFYRHILSRVIASIDSCFCCDSGFSNPVPRASSLSIAI